MSDLGTRTPTEFKADFPLNFSNGVRGTYLHGKDGKPIGVLLVHMRGKESCGFTAYWSKYGPSHKLNALWRLVKLEPLSLDRAVYCSCGFKGHIMGGKWRSA